jgi:hypothetical protein
LALQAPQLTGGNSMTTITNQTATTSWTGWVRGKAVAILNLAGSLRRAPATTADLERGMRIHSAELEHQQRKSRLLAGSYIGMID